MALAPAQQVEAQARAALEAKPAAPPRRPTATQERAQKIREQVEEESPRDALKSFVEPPMAKKDEREGSIDERIGHERNAATGKKERPLGSAAEKTFKAAKDADRLPSELYEKGYDFLNTTDQKAVRDTAEASIRERIPDIADTLLGPPGAPTSGKKAILENLLKDPKFRDVLRTKHTENLGKMMATTDGEINAAQKNFDEKDAAHTKIGREISTLTADLGKANAVIEGFDAKNITVVGTDAHALHELIINTPAIEAEIQRLDLKVTSLDKIVTALRNAEANHTVTTGNVAPAALRHELTRREGELETAIKDLGENRGKMAKKDALQAKLSDSEAEKVRIEGEMEQAKERQEAAAREKAIAQTDLSHKKLKREGEEADYIKGLGNSIRDAVSETVQTKLQEAQDAEVKVIAKEATETADADKKKVLDGLSREAIDDDGKGHYKLNKTEAKQIGADILAGGLDPFIEDWLMGNPPTRNPQEIKRIQEKMKDSDFMDDMRAKIGPTLVGRYLKAGGKFTEGDVIYLRGTEWGKTLPEEGIKAKKGLKQELDQLAAQGAIDKNFLQKLGSVDNSTWLKILIALVASAGLGLAVPAIQSYL